MDVVDDRPEEGYGHRLDTLLLEGTENLTHLLFVERHQGVALSGDALGDFEGQMAGNVGRRVGSFGVKSIPAAAFTQQQGVGKAVGGQQGSLGHFACQNCVGGVRGSVNDHVSIAQDVIAAPSNRFGCPAD